MSENKFGWFKKENSLNEQNQDSVIDEVKAETEEVTFLKESPIQGKQNETTYISATTIIKGTIESENSIIMHGTIDGDIKTTKDIALTGSVNGNIQAEDIVLESCRVNGNVTGENHIEVKEDTVIYGDIKSKTFRCNGSIQGNINAEDSVILLEKTIVQSDITSKNIEMERGSKIQGKINIV